MSAILFSPFTRMLTTQRHIHTVGVKARICMSAQMSTRRIKCLEEGHWRTGTM